MQKCQSIIAGNAVASSEAIIEKRYPATGEIIAHIEPATNEILDQAVTAATLAQKSWARIDRAERGRILHKAANLMREANDELARLEVQDVGKLYSEAVSADVPSGPDALDYFASLSATMTGDHFSWEDAIGYSESDWRGNKHLFAQTAIFNRALPQRIY